MQGGTVLGEVLGLVLGKAKLNAENSGKPSGGRDSAPNPRWGAHNAPQSS